MNKLKYLTFALVAVFMVSCAGKEELPFEEFDDLSYGAYARQLGNIEGIYDFFDIDGSDISFSVEFYDEAQGANVSSYSWTVAHPASGAGPVEIANVSSSSFGTSPDGLPSADFTFNFRSMLDALGLSDADINGGEFLDFQATVTKTDGSTFTSGNTGANIISSAPFSGLFSIRQDIVCPSALAGELTFETTDPWCGGDAQSGTAVWTETGVGRYTTEDFTYGAYTSCYGPDPTLPGGTLEFVDACNIISMSGADRWGDSYTILEILQNAGPDLQFSWENTYGEAGTVKLTRTDGADWPTFSL